MERGLGRVEPTDWKHVEKYPLTAYPVDAPTPMVMGTNWYSKFDNPTKDSNGRWFLSKEANLGYVRGGHAYCLKPAKLTDTQGWWEWYDQGYTGECVGFSVSRMMSLINRYRYQGEWLYMRATERDPWPDNDLDPNAGTSVGSALEVLKDLGHVRKAWTEPNISEGITAFRWATTVDEIHATIKMPLADSLGAVPFLNSWGTYYPHITWMPDETLDRLLHEYGEAGTVTDR